MFPFIYITFNLNCFIYFCFKYLLHLRKMNSFVLFFCATINNLLNICLLSFTSPIFYWVYWYYVLFINHLSLIFLFGEENTKNEKYVDKSVKYKKIFKSSVLSILQNLQCNSLEIKNEKVFSKKNKSNKIITKREKNNKMYKVYKVN